VNVQQKPTFAMKVTATFFFCLLAATAGAQTYPIVWASPTGVSLNGNQLTKTAAAGWGNAGAASVNILAAGANGWVERTVTAPLSSESVFGFSDVNTDAHFNTIDYGIYLGTSVIVYENGVNRFTLGTAPVAGDVLRVERTGTSVTYKRNGTVFYTSTVASSTLLMADAALNQVGAVISNANASFQDTYPVTWTNPVSATINGNGTVTYTGTVAWTSGATGANMLPENQDGWIQFTVANVTSTFMMSLTAFNQAPSYAASSHSLYLAGASVFIYEYNNNIGGFGTAAVNDVYRISREGGQMKFYKNGTLFATRTVQASYPLRPDVSLGAGSSPAVTCSFNALRPEASITNPTLANNNGSISVTPFGGAAPYTYVWSSGETTSSITGKARGAYTVTVRDASGQTVVRTYSLGFSVVWTNVTGAVVNGNNTVSSSSTSVFGGAASVNWLPANTDGWVEWICPDVWTNYAIGLSPADQDQLPQTTGLGFFHRETGIATVFTNGADAGIPLALAKGDVFRIQRTGGSIFWYKNGVQVHTITQAATIPLRVDVSATYGAVPSVTCSFDRRLTVRPTLTFPNPSSNTGGAIALTVEGAYTPLTISWSSGETALAISNKTRGNYTVTITDANGQSAVRTYHLGYPVGWTDLQNMDLLTTDNTVNTTAPGGWHGSAVSSARLPASTNGFVEFVNKANERGNFMLGLARPNNQVHFSTIDYCFYFVTSGEVHIYELGTSRGQFGYLAEGDVFRVAREGANIVYYRNGVALRTIAAPATYIYLADASFSLGKTPVVTTSFYRTPATFYSIASGNWNDGTKWSLTEGGPAAQDFPAVGDAAVVKGFSIDVQSGIYAQSLNISVTNASTCVKVNRNTTTNSVGSLNVKTQVVLQGLGNSSTTRAMVVENNAKINVN
jgi:SprB repeat